MKKTIIILSIVIFALFALIPLVVIGTTYASEGSLAPFILSVTLVPVIAAIIFVVAIIVSYKRKLRGAIYPLDKFTSLTLTDQSDVYSHSHTTRYKYKSSNKK